MADLSVFVGSSSEGLDFASAVRTALEADGARPGREHRIEVTLWNEDFFPPTATLIETLTNALPRFDFAVLLLTPDDMVTRRELAALGPRDNVLFELGLFMGHLGRARTFVMLQDNPEAEVRIPSDLEGLVTARYRPRNGGSHRAAVGSACDQILRLIRALGVSERKAGRQLAQITNRQDAVESQVRVLRLLAKGIITEPEQEKLRGLASDGPFLVWFHNDMMAELKHLDALRYLLPHPGRGLNDIYERNGRAEQFDLKQYVALTEGGREYLRLLDELTARQA